MNYKICRNCEHFMQHYIKSSKYGISKIKSGHCKEKQKFTKNCRLFKQGKQTSEDEFSILNLMNDYNNNFIKLIWNIGDLSLALMQLKNFLPLIDNKKEP